MKHILDEKSVKSRGQGGKRETVYQLVFDRKTYDERIQNIWKKDQKKGVFII